jgi:hypothetical protein
LVVAALSASAEPIQVSIRSECKNSFYGPDLRAGGSAGIRPEPDYVAWDPAYVSPLTFRDPRTQLTLYVESDGRHLAAINSNGALLWVRNPFDEYKLCPYRSPHPVIHVIETANILSVYWEYFRKRGMEPKHQFIKITFDSSQFGLVDEANGDFFLEGQN